MNWSDLKSRWDDYKASAKQRWSKLTDEQITGTLGKREHLSSRVQEAYALSQQDADREISEWQSQQVGKLASAR